MRFKVQIVPKAVDNIVYSGFCSLVCSVCKLFKWCASKQRPFGPLKRNKLGTWLFFWMTPKKNSHVLTVYENISNLDNSRIPGWPWNPLLP